VKIKEKIESAFYLLYHIMEYISIHIERKIEHIR